MATYYRGFDDADGISDWTEVSVNGTSHTFSVSSDVLSCDAGTVFEALTWDDINSDADRDDVEIVGQFKPRSATGTRTFVFRLSGTNGTGYAIRLRTTNFTAYRFSAGTMTSIADVTSLSLSSSSWYWVRFRINGSSVKARYWLDGDTEPGTWDVDTTDSTYSTAGQVGVLAGSGSQIQDWRYFGVGTNGDTAPTSGDTALTVNAGVGSLVLTGQAPSVSNDGAATASPDAGSLIITGQAPTLVLPLDANAGFGSLVISGQQPTVTLPLDVGAGVGSLMLTGQQPTIDLALDISSGAGSLVISGQQPTVQNAEEGTVQPASGSLILTGHAPQIILPLDVTAGVGSLVIDGQAPTVTAERDIAAGIGSLVLAGYAPTVEVSTALTANPDAAQIILTGYAPTISGDLIPSEVPRRQEAGGVARKASKRRRKPIIVTIDGQDFVVSSEYEAEQLAAAAAESARQVAEDQARTIIAKREKKARKARLNTSPLKLSEPQITIRPADDGRIDASWVEDVRSRLEAITDAYRAVAERYETSILLRLRQELDEEDELVTLLLTL